MGEILVRKLSVDGTYTKIVIGPQGTERLSTEEAVKLQLKRANERVSGKGLTYISDTKNPATTLDFKNSQREQQHIRGVPD